MSQLTTEIRNAELPDVLQILQTQRARRLDVVVTPQMISAARGNIAVAAGDATQLVTEDGVTSAAGSYRPTVVGDEGLGQLLSIDGGYLKKLRRTGRPDIWDANVNGMLHGEVVPDPHLFFTFAREPEFAPYDGSILLRLLKGDDEFDGVLRAALSPRYKIIDNLDVLLAVMQGIQQAGVQAVPDVCDLSDRRMYIRFVVPELAVFAPKLLEGYRSPFDGPGGVRRAGEENEGGQGQGNRPGMRLAVDNRWNGWTVDRALRAAAAEGQSYPPGQEPVVFAGLIVSNSDTGDGACSVAPQIRIKACKNGLTLVASADRRVHLGSKQSEGVVSWSAETMEAELNLITKQATDAVRTFLDRDWFLGKVNEIEKLAGAPVAEPEQVIKDVTKAAGFTKAEQEGILSHFLRGGAYTAGGVANAVSSFSQTVVSPDRQAELDAKAIDVMAHAARLAA